MNHENNNDESSEQSFLAKRQHAITVIESLQQSIVRFYHMCPQFCKGLIQDAFDSAFGLSLIKKRRPLLIYIHHNSCMPDLFSSEILIEFLHENYVVWPWDISIESNRQILIEIWKENFSEESFIDFSMDQCPMLIGIVRQISMENNSFIKYQSEILLINDVLVRTNEEFDPEILLYQLIVFKQEFDKNEKYFSSDFVQKIVACPELVIEIAEYLSLNDAVTTFSTAILSLLWKYNRKLPVISPSEEFIKTINQSNNQEKILSLRLKANQFKQTMKVATWDTFMHVTSLSIINFQDMKQICEIRSYFPALIYFSLRYEGEIDFHRSCRILNLIPRSIERFDIHCGSISCSHYRLDYVFAKIEDFNATIKSFVLHVDHVSRSLVNRCIQTHIKCILRTTIDFIRIMSNIQNVRIILNKGNIEHFIDAGEWMGAMDMCQQLKKISLKEMEEISLGEQLDQEMEKISRGEQLAKQIKEIESELQKIRTSIKLEVQVK